MKGSVIKTSSGGTMPLKTLLRRNFRCYFHQIRRAFGYQTLFAWQPQFTFGIDNLLPAFNNAGCGGNNVAFFGGCKKIQY